MYIKFQGFELTIEGRAISWDDLIEWLQRSAGTIAHHSGFDRILCLDQTTNPTYILGLFVTIKNNKRFTEIRQTHGQFELTARDLTANTRFADFNFFIIHKVSRKGIYQFYHQSCSLAQFLHFLDAKFLDIKTNRLRRAREQDRQGLDATPTTRQLEAARLISQFTVRKDTFDKLVAEFAAIKQMKFDIVGYLDQETIFSPLRAVAKKRTERILFKKGMRDNIVNGIRQTAHKQEVRNVSVTGTTGGGFETTIRLMENLQDFGHHDYEQLTEQFVVELPRFTQSRLIELLLLAAQENQHIIG